MSFNVEVESGRQVKLPTAGKYCGRDIVVRGTGSDAAELLTKYAEGLDAGAAACAARHFTGTFQGSGTASFSFPVPFEPDLVLIVGFDPTYAVSQTSVIGACLADLRAFGRIGGYCTYINEAGSMKSNLHSTPAVPPRYFRSEDGIFTARNLLSSTSFVFHSRYQYTVVAVRYTEQTDRERITAYVNGLSGSGTATLNQAKVSAAFTDDEWAALVAAKPNWTFTLI